MKRKTLTPQEKKLLSYTKDTRNTYGESRARSRFSIARNKANHHQGLRHEQKLILKQTIKVAEDEIEIVEAKMKSVKPKRWRKCADSWLGELISDKLKDKQQSEINEELKRGGILESAKKRWRAISRYRRWD